MKEAFIELKLKSWKKLEVVGEEDEEDVVVMS